MKSLAIRCPECNAALDVSGDAIEARCAYCHTVARIQRRTRWLQRPAPLPPQAPEAAPLPVARQARTLAGILALALGLLVPLALLLGLPATLFLKRAGAAPAGPALLADVDGDGHADLVVQLRNRERETNYLAAYRGTDGKRLWQSPALDGGAYLTKLCLADDVLLQHRNGASVRGFALADGALRFEARLPEAARELCAGGAAGSVRAITADEQAHALSLANGAVRAEGRYLCSRPLRCWDAEQTPEQTATSAPSIKLPGMNVKHLLSHRATGATVALGYKHPGTPVPMVAALAPESLRDVSAGARRLFGGVPAAARWQAQVPERDPLAVHSRPDLRLVAFDGAALAVCYELRDRHRLTVFSLADGRRRFDIELPAAQRSIQAVLLTLERVYTVSAWGVAAAFDVQRGTALFTID